MTERRRSSGAARARPWLRLTETKGQRERGQHPANGCCHRISMIRYKELSVLARRLLLGHVWLAAAHAGDLQLQVKESSCDHSPLVRSLEAVGPLPDFLHPLAVYLVY